MARPSPGAPPPTSPLPSAETSTLSSLRAASGGPQLSADLGWLSHRRGRSCGCGNDAGQAPSDLSCHRLLAMVFSLIGQDCCNIIVGGRCEVHCVVLPPYRESSTAPDACQFLTAVEAAEHTMIKEGWKPSLGRSETYTKRISYCFAGISDTEADSSGDICYCSSLYWGDQTTIGYSVLWVKKIHNVWVKNKLLINIHHYI